MAFLPLYKNPLCICHEFDPIISITLLRLTHLLVETSRHKLFFLSFYSCLFVILYEWDSGFYSFVNFSMEVRFETGHSKKKKKWERRCSVVRTDKTEPCPSLRLECVLLARPQGVLYLYCTQLSGWKNEPSLLSTRSVW